MAEAAKFAPVDLAYAAGIIDGEGCINISPRKYPDRPHIRTNYCVRVSVLTTDNVICPWLQAMFGGAIHTYTDKRRGVKAAKGTLRRWSLSMRATVEFLRALLPYLKLKRERAEVALEFASLLRGPGGSIPLSDENMAHRLACYSRMRELNKKREAA